LNINSPIWAHKKGHMNLKQAFGMVLELAEDNILSDFQVGQDFEMLKEEQENQTEACEIVRAEYYAMDAAGMFD
jgi:hypothetical protein